MNYIKHLNTAMDRMAQDDRLKATHVSMYITLFHFWNQVRFRNPVSINRAQIMQRSKIGSKATYHKCMKDLHAWKYLKYEPSHDPSRGSQVYMINFDTEVVPKVGQEHVPELNRGSTGNETTVVPKVNNSSTESETTLVPLLVPSINSKQLNKNKGRKVPPSLNEVKEFFENIFPPPSGGEISEGERGNLNQLLELEAKKFINHYTSNGWKVGKVPMEDWQAAAENWIIRANEKALVQYRDNLSVNTDKEYDQPL